jgi:hypothetical protein
LSARNLRLALLALGTAGCFGETPVEPITDPPETLLLVQGVLRTDHDQQFVLVERSFNGTVAGSGVSEYLPGGGLPVPVEGADVRLSNLSFPGDPCGAEVEMTEEAGPAEQRGAGVYFGPVGCPAMRAGDTIQILVGDGEHVAVGRTVIPGVSSITITADGETIDVPGPLFEFNRDTDTLAVDVEATSGRVLLTEIHDRRFFESSSYLAFESGQVWVDDTRLELPGNLINLLTQDSDLDDDLPSLFNAGRYVAVTVGFGDEVFHDQIRSANNPITGRGFVNRIEGGYGFLSSMTAAQTTLRVVGNIDDPREGTYRMSGRVASGPDSVDVDVTWELYLNDEIRNDGGPTGFVGLSAFVVGDWVEGAYDAYTEGTFEDDFFRGFLVQPTGGETPEGDPELRIWELGAPLGSSTPVVRVTENGTEVGRLTVVRQ